MRLAIILLFLLLLTAPARASGISVNDVVSMGQAMLDARLGMTGDAPGDGGRTGDGPSSVDPEYNPADALATSCFADDDCFSCMQPAIELSNEAYEVLARNHAWKSWVAKEYKRMDALASGITSLNPYTKTAYALTKSRDILPAKRAFENNVKTAQTTTLNSLRSAFVKIGSCEAEFLGKDNFSQMALLAWQIMKVKYLD